MGNAAFIHRTRGWRCYTLSVAPKIYANACARLFVKAFAGFDLMFALLLDCEKLFFLYRTIQ